MKSNKYLFKILTILFLGVALVSCESDDDNNNDNEASLVGLWNLTSYTYSGDIVTENMGVTITTEYMGEAINIDSTLDIGENPNTINTAGSYDIVLTTIFLGEEIEQTVPIADATAQGTWTRNGNILTIEGELVAGAQLPAGVPSDINTQDYTIAELTATTLRLTLSTSFEINQAGVNNSYTLNTDIVLNR